MAEGDHFAIANQLARLARIFDTRNWAALAEVFTEDVIFDYGDGTARKGLEALTGQFRKYLDGCGRRPTRSASHRGRR